MKLYDQSYSTSCSALHYSTVHSAKTCNHTILVLWRLWDMNMNRNRIFNKISRILQTLFKDTFSNSVIFIVKWTDTVKDRKAAEIHYREFFKRILDILRIWEEINRYRTHFPVMVKKSCSHVPCSKWLSTCWMEHAAANGSLEELKWSMGINSERSIRTK